jgi:hypothetical protein
MEELPCGGVLALGYDAVCCPLSCLSPRCVWIRMMEHVGDLHHVASCIFCLCYGEGYVRY